MSAAFIRKDSSWERVILLEANGGPFWVGWVLSFLQIGAEAGSIIARKRVSDGVRESRGVEGTEVECDAARRAGQDALGG